MKKFWSKGMAAILTASMLLSGAGNLALAEDVTEAPVAAVQEAATEAPATEAPVTEAPVTEAPETEAPATEAPVTEAPATEAPVTEAPATEAPVTEMPKTEAPATETQATEAPETEAQTKESAEKETKAPESETESGVYTVEEKEYTVSVELPDDVKLPEEAELKAKLRKAEDESYEDSLALAEEECGYTFAKYLIYDLHFEKDGEEVELAERTKEDIKVTLTFEKEEYKGLDLSDEKIEVYHIKDRTDEEIAQAREAASDGEEVAEQKAVELEVKQETLKMGASISFKTDGFSDYVIGIPNEEKAEEQTESEEQSETESEAITEEETESETEKATEVAGEEAVVTATAEGEPLQIDFKVLGTPTAASHLIQIAGDPANAPEAAPTVAINGQAATGEAVYDAAANVLKINVPANVTSAAITVNGLPDGNYTVNAGGNYIDNSAVLMGNADYTSYCDAGLTHGETELSFTLPLLGASKGISVTDRYTAVNVSLTDKTAKAGVSGAKLKLQRQQNGEWKDIANTAMETVNGSASLTGLPFGKYRVVCESVPGVYAYTPVGTPVEFELAENTLMASAAFATSQISVRVRAVDPDGNRIKGAEFQVDGHTLTYTDNTLRGVLERGKQYSVTQTVTPYGYVKAKNVKVTPQDSTKVQVVEMLNKPTVVQISALSKADGSRIAGVSFEVRDSSGKAVDDCSWTSTDSVYVLKAKLQPGTKYTLVQTAVPDGYYPASSKTFTVSKNGNIDTVTMTNEVTKVSISRKGYDSRTKKSDGKYEYTNMKMLSGAVLEVQDANGNAIERWTSTEEAHVITGKLAAGEKYRLVEITSPDGYEKGGSGEFTVKTKEKVDSTKNTTTSVTMQTRRASGKVQVVKRAALNGKAIKLDQTYYCALFLDEAKTQRYGEGGVKALNMTSDTVYASATFTNIPAGTYYVAETDRNGNALSSSDSSRDYTITITNEKLNLSAGASLIAEIVNDYKSQPGSGYTNVTSKELKDSYKQEYANYGGSAQAAAAMAEGDGTVSTGDSTNIAIYVVLIVAAALLIVAAVVIRKKKKK